MSDTARQLDLEQAMQARIMRLTRLQATCERRAKRAAFTDYAQALLTLARALASEQAALEQAADAMRGSEIGRAVRMVEWQ